MLEGKIFTYIIIFNTSKGLGVPVDPSLTNLLNLLNLGNVASVFEILTSLVDLKGMQSGNNALEQNALKESSVALVQNVLNFANNFDTTGITGVIAAFAHQSCPVDYIPN